MEEVIAKKTENDGYDMNIVNIAQDEVSKFKNSYKSRWAVFLDIADKLVVSKTIDVLTDLKLLPEYKYIDVLWCVADKCVGTEIDQAEKFNIAYITYYIQNLALTEYHNKMAYITKNYDKASEEDFEYLKLSALLSLRSAIQIRTIMLDILSNDTEKADVVSLIKKEK